MTEVPTQAVLQGRRRLRALLPAARADARRKAVESRFEDVSPLASATIAGLREEHFDALAVYEGERGGWHCDLLFRDRPEGVPNSMGSPVAAPFHTREDAEAFARPLLTSVLALIAQRDAGAVKAGPPVFWLHELTFDLDPAALAGAGVVKGDYDLGHADVLAGLHRMLDKLGLADGCTVKQITALDREQHASLSAALHGAAVHGVFSWPPREARQPGERTAMEQWKLEP